jgi:hypothetical protein
MKTRVAHAWLPVALSAALLDSSCKPGGCLLCPTDKPFEGALPAQGPGVHAEIDRISLWDTDCNSLGCGGRPEVVSENGTYALGLGEVFYLELEVRHPGVQYRELSIQISQSWGFVGDLARTFGEREDQVLLFSHRRAVYVKGRLPVTQGVYSIHVRVEERGPDLPSPIIIERELPIHSGVRPTGAQTSKTGLAGAV